MLHLNLGEYPLRWVGEGPRAEWRRQRRQHLPKQDKGTAPGESVCRASGSGFASG